jgi:hypothetical protein
MEKGRKAQSLSRKGVRMKHFIISVEGFEESPEGDIRQFACEEHQLILNEDEQFVGICMVYTGSKPLQIDSNS